MVTYSDIDPHDVGQRLDNFLLRQLKGVPRQHVYKVIRSGEVRVNGKRAKPSQRLSLGDRIRIPPVRQSAQQDLRPSATLQTLLLTRVVYEDKDILAINKPAGVAVHGGSSVSSGVIEQLRLATSNPRLALVHRLDRDTSGCLLMARKPGVLKTLQDAFAQRQVKKIYDLIVVGVWPKRTREVRLALQRYQTSWGERRVNVNAEGKAARTDFNIVHSSGAYTWLRARLHTGRTHQIRVHAKAQGHPVVGDTKYGHSKMPDAERLMLHASRLHVPYAGSLLKLESPVDPDLQEFWEQVNQVKR
ncbi:MAG: RluA family pseudouridine synthase [Pseudomonadota bacterium]|nr:RluA family pseudouridine synthase [Pseudomonadota bacterium]